MASIKIPREMLSESQISERAEAVRSKHDPDGVIPVPIIDILEFGLEISIAPAFSIQRLALSDVDAYLLPDCTSIRIDSHTWMRSPHRTRFSLAHECAHAVLHPNAYLEVCGQIKSVGEYKQVMGSLDETEYGWIEWQANCFAGHLLVPSSPLKEQFQATCSDLGFDPENIDDGQLEAISKVLRDVFSVSPGVAKIRCKNDGLVAK